MNALTELALLFKQRDNPKSYTPLFGRIVHIAPLEIRLNDKVILFQEQVIQTITIDQTDINGRYININREVVLLPLSNYQKFILIGVVQ